MRLNLSTHPSKVATASLFALATLAVTSAGFAQLYPVYSENFNSTATYTLGDTLSDQSGWTTNDEGTGGTYSYPGSTAGIIGQSDGINLVPNVSTAPGDYVGFIGGAYGKAVAPGRSNVTLNHSLPTNNAQTVSFSTDFLVTAPTASNPVHDGFGFSLTGTGGASLFSINFAVRNDNSAASDNVTYTVGATTTTSPYAISLLTQRYKLTINANVASGTFSAFLQAEDATGALTAGSLVTIASNQTYALAGAGNIAGYAALWNLTNSNPATDTTLANNPATAGTNNRAYSNAGTNALYFDNVFVSVPEPSTYAMLGLGALGLIFMARRVRLA